MAHPCRPIAEVRDARFPVSLTTGRLRDPRHAMSCTGTLGRLFAQASEPALELHPQELVRRGELILPVDACASVLPARAFIAMHWGSL